MAALRIVVMTNRFGDLGTHPQLSRLALHLKKSGHDVRAVTLAPAGTIADTFAEAGIEMDVIDGSRNGSLPLVVGKLVAFASELPVVGTDVGGMRKLFDHGSMATLFFLPVLTLWLRRC